MRASQVGQTRARAAEPIIEDIAATGLSTLAYGGTFGTVRHERVGANGRAPDRVLEQLHISLHWHMLVPESKRLPSYTVQGQEKAISAALAASPVSTMIHTVFVERHHGTDRHRNGRKIRKTLSFSKDWQVHSAVTSCTMDSYNFCWPVRTLRIGPPEGGWQPRPSAMAAGLVDHRWSLTEWLTFSVVQLK